MRARRKEDVKAILDKQINIIEFLDLSSEKDKLAADVFFVRRSPFSNAVQHVHNNHSVSL